MEKYDGTESFFFGENGLKNYVSTKERNSNSAYDFLRDTYNSSDDESSDSSETSEELNYKKDFPEENQYKTKEGLNETSVTYFNQTSYRPKDKGSGTEGSKERSSQEGPNPSKDSRIINPKSSFLNLEAGSKSEKIRTFASKVSGNLLHKYCCMYCNTKNEVNFRYGRLSECKSCESKKQIYRRNLRLSTNRDLPILMCSVCYEHSKPCELCSKIQYHVKARKLNKSQNYLCLSCGTDIKERFVEGVYSRCRGCKNDTQVQKYREAKIRNKDIDLMNLSHEELERLKVVKTIPGRVEILENQVQELSRNENLLKTELEELKMENFMLKETMEDEFSSLKKQIKELKFIIRN
jgi:hypothetical protein